MTTWVALLRGVNVNGITVRSADLRDLFDQLGFTDVRTVLASGNVVFSSTAAAPALKTKIEKALRDRFGYDAWIVLVTRAAVAQAVEAFPFDAADASRQPYVVFASDEAVLIEILAAAPELDPDADPVARGTGVVYWHPVKGTTVDTPFGRLLSKKTYRESTTNRNLRTLQKIVS
ncbi:DUF1697 domain-containing protein [Microbacterium pygmaeum]|uniref:Uncharacterized conserved protein, DUF1697 family n=1 Tax=Microbacterium pygmaeum TaxID=370764 RepID=A0A1G8B245_9MICO|nr:DUF1697 domain-containing protein [Microbacterium pygmaeum]SDH27257.1 Uncharacterized conserved protein, DUF1697 family [Microbacterium pygmaeum]